MTAAAFTFLTLLPVALCERLDATSYRARAAAHRALAGFGRLAVPALERHAACGTPEARRRCEILLSPYAEEVADRGSHVVMPTGWPRRPWLSLYDCPVTHYLARAREQVKTTGAPDWPEYREATRLWVRSLLLQRRPVEEIVAELDRMAAEESWWIIQNGKNYRPEIKLPGAP